VHPLDDVEADRGREARGLVQPRLYVAARRPSPQVGESDDGTGAAGELGV